jgi:hypothetical protein
MLFARVFDEPGMVFNEITARPRIGAPMLAIILVFFLRAFAMPDAVLRKETSVGLDAAAKFAPAAITPEIRQRALDKATTWVNRTQGAVFGSLGVIVFVLIGAAIFQGLFSLAGADVTYKQELSIVLYACAPVLLGIVVILALTPVTQSSTFNVGLGFAVSTETSPYLHALMAQFTIFTMWQLYLLALGNQIQRKAKTIGGSLTLVGGLWFVFALLGAWIGAKFGGGMMG